MKVIFGRNNKPLSWLIRVFTWSRWSHVGILMENQVLEATASNGVVLTDLSNFKKRYKSYEICQIPSEQGWEERALSQLGKHYDWSAIFGIILRVKINAPDKWFCSELVAYSSGVFRKNIMNRITPEDNYRISKEIE